MSESASTAAAAAAPAADRRLAWVEEYSARLREELVGVRRRSASVLAPAQVLAVDPEDWARAGAVAAAFGCRWAAFWADLQGDTLLVRSALEKGGCHLVLETRVPLTSPRLASLTPQFPAADRPERHAHDLLGLELVDHPQPHRWTRHQAWPETRYPLRPDDFPPSEKPPGATPPDPDYPFARVDGSGVFEIPVGPVHAGIIEPGHFRFHAVGEEVLRLEERLGYVHKGIEKLAVGRDAEGLARLAGRVSGDSTVAHTWAACQALERAVGCAVPPRALHLRALLAERERVANHLGDIGAICNDVAFAFALAQLGRLREVWQRRNHQCFGHRMLMDVVVPGGVRGDIGVGGQGNLRADHRSLREEVEVLFDLLEDNPSLMDRLVTTGRLDPETAGRMGAVGYVGRASGQAFDARRDSPYPPYDGLQVRVPVFSEGDVAARMRVRMEEVRVSLDLMDELLETLPPGATRAPWPVGAGGEGLGVVEGWRGEVLTYVRLDATGRVARFFPRDPSWLTWPALEQLILGNIVPDFPVCNKSVNGSYSGQDL
ncbi:MAG: NADH-quinone oxidoreductase subunit C [Gammaproteobacteria bacterium]|nr:NADH-quinone oxidoreductase subunit C [Gammaproteobacteria bacterium]